MRIEGLPINVPVEPRYKEIDLSPKQQPNQSGTINQQAPEEKQYPEKEIIKAIEEANKEFVAYDRRFEFSVHEKTKEIVIKVIDTKTDEVIREIPPEKILDMVAKLCELAGVFVDEKV